MKRTALVHFPASPLGFHPQRNRGLSILIPPQRPRRGELAPAERVFVHEHAPLVDGYRRRTSLFLSPAGLAKLEEHCAHAAPSLWRRLAGQGGDTVTVTESNALPLSLDQAILLTVELVTGNTRFRRMVQNRLASTSGRVSFNAEVIG